MTQTLAALGVVVATIFAAAWLLRRLQSGAGLASPLVKTIGAAHLGPRERVVVVEVGETWLVLGVAQGSVRTLHTLPRGELPAAAATQAFAGVLAKFKRPVGDA
jgi:flagellar protein FliO/FliZ